MRNLPGANCRSREGFRGGGIWRTGILWVLISLLIVFIPSCVYSDLQQKSNPIQVRGVDPLSVHRRLESAGFEPGPYSETDTAELSEAVRRFQRFAKLDPTGKVDGATWKKMQLLYDPRSASGQPARVSAESPGTAARSGGKNRSPGGRKVSIGPAWPPIIVQITQEILNRLDYNPGRADGVWDSKTAAAIGRYQKESGMAATDSIDRKTLAALIESDCRDGCEFRLFMTPADMAVLSALWFADAEPVEGTTLEGFLIQALQIMLQRSGYETDPPGDMGTETRRAVREFQSTLPGGKRGVVNAETVHALFSRLCAGGCQFIVSNQLGSPASRQQSSPLAGAGLEPIPPNRSYENYPLNVGDNAFAVEKSECSDISGDWIIFYEGIVAEKERDSVSVRLEKRFGYRFHPGSEGLDKTDWWCIPRRRHCYSTIDFKDWGGAYAPGQVISFPADRVFNARITIINGISQYLRTYCRR